MLSKEYTQIDRNIHLYGMVNNESAIQIVSAIKEINQYDDLQEQMELELLNSHVSKGVLKENSVQGLEPREPIILEINSGGGYASSGFSIISAIEQSQTPIVGIVTGDCMSMAVPVFASCHYRISKRFAGFMIHDAYTGAEGKFNDIEKTVEYLKQVRNNYKDILVEYTSMKEERVDEIINANSDFYFDPKIAKEIGLVDAIEDDIDEDDMLNKLYNIAIPEPEESSDSEEEMLKVAEAMANTMAEVE